MAGAQLWLPWELDRLLKPLEVHPDDWSLLQRIENQARELLQALPSGGALRHRAERRLQEALGVIPQPHRGAQQRSQTKAAVVSRPKAPAVASSQARSGQPASPLATPAPSHGHQEEPRSVAVDRAEFRALRLFVCSPVCRDPLSVLVIDNDLYRRAQHCLAQLLEHLCSLDPDVRERLFKQPEGEMMAVLDVLEPVG
ncbi:MAG: hypothetical protein NTY67_11205 [Cyanobacteria bacterium]|nr:hypothetical protein [Cyanobacteriota bacterium]